jgi:flavin-dependent dehydrogenase
MAACLLAQAGVRVLLVERSTFPRPKVCGGCLNALAVATLERAGLAARVRACGAREIDALVLRHRGRTARLAIPRGLAVSRDTLDPALAAGAVSAGAVLDTGAVATVVEGSAPELDEGRRQVSLQWRDGRSSTASARVVLAADGLAHSSLRACARLRSVPARGARVGIGGLAPAGILDLAGGTITMAVGGHGYVGAVDVEDGRVNVAAAIDAGFLRSRTGAGDAVASILEEAGVKADRGALVAIDWGGTIPLTRRMPRPASRRLFVIGDAAGYVEPFTGEGMAWAFGAAEAVVPLAQQAIAGWRDRLAEEWCATYARRIGREQRWCRAVASVLRVPALVALQVVLLGRHPALARPVLAHFDPRAPRS